VATGATGIFYFPLLYICRGRNPRNEKAVSVVMGKKIGGILKNSFNKLDEIMKNNRQHLNWSSIILGLAVLGVGCMKTGATVNMSPVSYVSVMNLAPYGSSVDIYFNATLVSPAGGILPEQFSTEYGQLKPGSYTVDFKKAGTDSLLVELPAAVYDTSNFYTLVIYNTQPGGNAVQATRIQDNLSQISTSYSYYRFLNMSPDAQSVNLLMNGTSIQMNRTPADNVGSQSYDQFQSINPGEYTIQVQNSTTDSLLASQSNYPFAAANVYTVILMGTSKGMSVSVLPVVF
jgi:hypothetical protein